MLVNVLNDIQKLMLYDNIMCDVEILAEFSSDAAIKSPDTPVCVVQPAAVDEVSAIMSYACGHEAAVVPAES